MASLLIGPMLRYVSGSEATIWLEADAACTVEILGRRSETFQVNGRHYAIVAITELAPGSCVEGVLLEVGDLETRQPPPPSSTATVAHHAWPATCRVTTLRRFQTLMLAIATTSAASVCSS